MCTLARIEQEKFFVLLFMILLTPKGEAINRRYNIDDYFTDIICAQEQAAVTANVSKRLLCAIVCSQNSDCKSFFFDENNLKCYIFNVVFTSRIENCIVQVGVKYYTIPLVPVSDGCYSFTAEDEASPSTGDQAKCESYPDHKYAASPTSPHCADCSCCQFKGSYTGATKCYNNTWSYTKTGKRCQRWDSQSPHGHDVTYIQQYGDIYAAHNYCRDPDRFQWGELWCYTEDPTLRWEACGISECQP